MIMDCPPVNLIHLQLSVRPVVWLTNLIRQDESIMAFQIDLFVGEQLCVFIKGTPWDETFSLLSILKI